MFRHVVTMLKDCFEKYYYDQNYNCAETMIRAANEYFNLKLHDRDMIMLGGFDPQDRCKKTIEAACDILEAVIADYEVQR